eukprot:9430280-Heterocapsa_arctica.AAC.1
MLTHSLSSNKCLKQKHSDSKRGGGDVTPHGVINIFAAPEGAGRDRTEFNRRNSQAKICFSNIQSAPLADPP